MNADEIRAEAIERLARARYTAVNPGYDWNATTEFQRNAHRQSVAAAVDALGDLLPTWVEHDAFSTPGTMQRRYVTEWRTVDGE